jgi:hypothetical protein
MNDGYDLYAEEIRREEEEERISTTIEAAQERMAEKIECDECGQKLSAIYDGGKLKVDCYHSCDIPDLSWGQPDPLSDFDILQTKLA